MKSRLSETIKRADELAEEINRKILAEGATEERNFSVNRRIKKTSSEKEDSYQESLKPVKDYFKQIKPNIQIDLKKILKSGKAINIVLTATQLGKSLGFGMWVSEEILKDQNNVFVWIRRHEKEIQNTVVSLFRTLLGGVEGLRITLRGVFLNGQQVVYFIPLNVYYNYKSLTGLASKLRAIIFDEAIPLDRRYLDDSYSTEENKFTQLVNILARKDISSKEVYLEVPIYFLCNPNAKGAWIVQRWFPNYVPSNEKEKAETKGIAFIYSKPWPKEKSRGIVDELESPKEKLVSKFGVYSANEEMFMTNLLPTKYILSFVIQGREYELGTRGDNFIITPPMRKRDKKLIIFNRGDFLLYEEALLIDTKERNWYFNWWYTLLGDRRLFFTSYQLRDSFIQVSQRNWTNLYS